MNLPAIESAHVEATHGRPVPIESLKKGDYFRLLGFKSKDVKVFDGYNRSTRKYSYYSFNDINKFGEKKKGTLVNVGFDF